MRYEKIFKREDGRRVKITAEFYANYLDRDVTWRVFVETMGKGKRLWLSVFSEYDLSRVASENKKQFILDAQLKHCTVEEIHEVKILLWNAIKPEP